MSVVPGPVSRPRSEGDGCGCLSGGCLKGCGITLLVLTVLLIAGVAWALIYGRPLLATQLPSWESRQPLLTPLLDHTALRAWLVPQAETQQGGQERIEGRNDRNLVPNDVTLQEYPVLETYSVSADQVTAYQEVASGPDAVREYFLHGMSVQGWTLIAQSDIEGRERLAWAKDDRTCQVEIVAGESCTQLWLRCEKAR